MNKFYIGTISICILLFFGCTKPPAYIRNDLLKSTIANGSGFSTISPSDIQTNIPSNIPATDSLFSKKVIPSPTLTLNLYTTITPKEKEDTVTNLLLTNNGCSLPCWWGIVPGKSNWIEVNSFLSQLGAQISDKTISKEIIKHETGNINLIDNTILNGLTFFERNGVINSIFITGEGIQNITDFRNIWNSYLLESVFKKFGKPSRIFLTIPNGPFEEPVKNVNYDLWIAYDQLGILMVYTGSVKFEPTMRLCPMDKESQNFPWSLNILLQEPDNPEKLETTYGNFGFFPDKLVSLEKATGLTVDDFYSLFFQNGNSICFSTSRENWK